ncbi:hypothetical protein [Phormidesmis priestleyi]
MSNFQLEKIIFLAITAITFSPVNVLAQENTNFPLVSMEIRVVPEQAVCQLPDGYNSGTCPILSYEYVETLRGRSIKTQPIPPDQEVPLGDLFGLLGSYRNSLQAQKGLSLGQRKSALFVFDFGDPQQNKKPDFDITIEGTQKGRGCNDQDIPETKWSYSSGLSASSQYSIYHSRADVIIPCSSVTWILTAKDRATSKTYKWTFKTKR